jgi:hypothetical protein
MATIAGPRAYPRPVRTPVDITNFRNQIPLKRSPRRHSKQGTTQPTLRDSYLEASVRSAQKLLALRDSSRLALLREQESSASPNTHMAPFSSYKRLSSGPSSPASFSTSLAANVPATDQEVASTETQPGIVSSPVSLRFFHCLQHTYSFVAVYTTEELK